MLLLPSRLGVYLFFLHLLGFYTKSIGVGGLPYSHFVEMATGRRMSSHFTRSAGNGVVVYIYF